MSSPRLHKLMLLLWRNLPPDKRRLLESHRQVMDDTRALSRLRAEMATEKVEIDMLLVSLIGVCNIVADALDEQTRLREETVNKINIELLKFGVNLQVAPLARRSVFEDLSNRFAKGADIFNNLNSFASDVDRHHRRLARAYESP